MNPTRARSITERPKPSPTWTPRKVRGPAPNRAPHEPGARVSELPFRELRSLDFREGETRRALSELATRSDGQALTVETLVQDALALLT